MLIQWSEKYSTGVVEIDNQHKEIINQLNRLHEAITSGLGKDVIMDILEFTQEYAASHFAFEESCMDKYQCPVAKQNKDAHQKFIQRFKEIEEALLIQDVEVITVLEIYRELRDWITSHILKIDTHLRACAARHPQSMSDHVLSDDAS